MKTHERGTRHPEHLRRIAEQVPRGRHHHSPDGSHMALADDHHTYVAGLLARLRDLDATLN
jgi:proline iminopeptidase